MAQFQVRKGQTLFQDGEDSVEVFYLQRCVEDTWVDVLELHLEIGRSWGDQIDLLYRNKANPDELLVHVSGFGYWGDAEYYQSEDGGFNWTANIQRRKVNPDLYTSENLLQDYQ